MEEKKTFVQEMEEDFKADKNLVVMEELMDMLIKMTPVYGLKFIHKSGVEGSRLLEDAINILLSDEDLTEETYRQVIKNLCYCLIHYRQQQRLIATAYNQLKSDKDEPIPVEPKTAEEEPEEDDDDDDRTK